MKFRNQFLKYKLFSVGEGDMGGGDGGTPNGNPGDENNGDDNSHNYDDLWHTGSNEEASSQKNNQQTVVVQQQATPSAEESFNAHLQSLDLSFDNQAYQAALQNQDFEAADRMMTENNQRVYKQAMINLNRVINTRLEQVQEKMQENTQTTLQSNEIVSQMQKALPFTKQARYEPIAKAVLKQLLEKGVPAEKAIAQTGNYFKSLADDVGKTLPKPPRGKPQGGFDNYDNDGQQTDETPDWISFLGGAPQAD